MFGALSLPVWLLFQRNTFVFCFVLLCVYKATHLLFLFIFTSFFQVTEKPQSAIERYFFSDEVPPNCQRSLVAKIAEVGLFI